jgi:hypothetical protein
MKKLLLSIFAFSGLVASAQITDLPTSSAQIAVTVGGSTNITTTGSELGINYVLRNDSDNSFIGTPQLGTGGDLTFNTGAINNNSTFNVFATNAISLNFNNNSDVINLDTNTRNVVKEVTVAAWIKTSTTGNAHRNIVQQYGGSGSDAGYVLRLSPNGKAYMDGREGTTNYRSSGESTSILTDNLWHYTVGTINLTTGVWSIYVDGVLENSAIFPAGVTLAASGTNLKIGGQFSTTRALIGKIRDVTIWNESLSTTEIATNFTGCISGSENNVVGHFPINEGQGTEILDYSSLGINGTNNISLTPNYPWVLEYTACRDTLEMSQLINVSVSGDVLVNSITVQGQNGHDAINTDMGTLQMEATVLPANALDGSYTWTLVNGTGFATLDANGVLTAVTNGTVLVKATANDGSGTSDTITIRLNNQSTILVSSISVNGAGNVSTISTAGGTLQMEASVLPSKATSSYSWSVADGTGSATISATGLLTAVTDGVVTVTVTANDVLGKTASMDVTLSNQSLGLNELALNKVKIYPNPVQNELFIELENGQINTAIILDLSGKVIQSIANTNANSLNVSALKQGVYILKIKTESNTFIKRFIKQ